MPGPVPSLQPPFRKLAPLALAVMLAASPGQPAQPTIPEARRLAAGEVLISSRTVEPRKPREGIGRGVIDFPPERVFRAITDLAHYDEFMPFVKRSEVVRTLADGTVLSRQRLKLPGPFGERYYTLSVRSRVEAQSGKSRGVWRTQWSYVRGSGNIADQRGSWILEELSPGRTLATFRLYTDPGGLVPAWTIEKALAETLPYIFDGLRQHVRRSRYDAPAEKSR
ncbi:MAG TPA: SRPBCC family protein [Thermoanaerobaculia bacterium]|nr:SRPBCC family protein [Thermoanaerobaculia bacterium]